MIRASWITLWLCLFAPGLARADNTSPRLARERIVLHTNFGDLVLALYPDVAPHHVAQILKLVKLGVYDTTCFIYVDPNFLVQISDASDRLTPLTPKQKAAIHPLKAEFSNLRHVRGSLTMARNNNDPDSATTSFSILLADAPHLDGKYTIFGRLERGQVVLRSMVDAAQDSQHRPLKRIELQHAEIVDATKVPNVLRSVSPEPEMPVASESPVAWIYIVAIMMALALAIYFAAGKAQARIIASLGMLIFLTGYFLIFLALAPRAKENPWISVSVFVSSIAIFKAMSFFERPQ